MMPLRKVESFSSTESRQQDSLALEALNDERTLRLEDLLEVLRRRKIAFSLPLVAVLVASVILAWKLPIVYRSTATILIEQQEIPSDLVRSTVSSFADERIQTITQRVLTTSNLQRIIERFDLYPELRQEVPLAIVADRVRNDFMVERESANRGRFQTTIAFNISFESRSPSIAQAVATELTSLYLEENLKTRTESAADTTQFLRNEAERIGSEISELEAKIATFKEMHMGRLPEQLDLNLDLMSRIERRIEELERQGRALEDRKFFLQASMTRLEEESQVGSNEIRERIKDLRAHLRSMLAVYTPDHPDVARVRNEIAVLERQAGPGAAPETLKTELEERRADLAQALKTYSSQHPDVQLLQRQIEILETAVGQSGSQETLSNFANSGASGYAELKMQYQSADREIDALRSERRELNEKLAQYEDRVNKIPQIEREYSLLVRDRDNLMGKYQEIRSKLSGARIAQNLEIARKGERFSLIEPARLPIKPIKPNRKKILAFGFLGSIGTGIGAVVVSEYLHKAVYGVRGVTSLLGSPPLAVIPFIETSADRRRRLLKIGLIVLGLLILIAAGSLFVHFQIMQLEEVWELTLTRFDHYWAIVSEYFEKMAELATSLVK